MLPVMNQSKIHLPVMGCRCFSPRSALAEETPPFRFPLSFDSPSRSLCFTWLSLTVRAKDLWTNIQAPRWHWLEQAKNVHFSKAPLRPHVETSLVERSGTTMCGRIASRLVANWWALEDCGLSEISVQGSCGFSAISSLVKEFEGCSAPSCQSCSCGDLYIKRVCGRGLINACVARLRPPLLHPRVR